MPSGRRATASGGRLGPRRTTSSRRHRHAGRAAGLVGQGPGLPGHRAVALAPEGTAVGQRGGRPAARPAPAGVGLHVGRLDPGRLEREGPAACGDRHRGGQRHRAVASLDPAGGGPGRPEVRGQRGVGAELHRGPRRRAVVGEAAAAQHDVGARVLEGGTLELGPPGGQQRIAGRAGHCRRRQARRPGRAPARPPRGSTANPCSGTGGPAAHPRRRAATHATTRAGDDERGRGRGRLERGQAQHDARRAEPALAGPGGHEGVGPAVPLCRGHPLDRGHLPPGHPAHRGHAGHPGQPVDPDGATAALALRATAVLDRTAAEVLAQRVEERDAVGDGDLAPVEDEGNEEGVWSGTAQGTGRPDGRRLS